MKSQCGNSQFSISNSANSILSATLFSSKFSLAFSIDHILLSNANTLSAPSIAANMANTPVPVPASIQNAPGRFTFSINLQTKRVVWWSPVPNDIFGLIMILYFASKSSFFHSGVITIFSLTTIGSTFFSHSSFQFFSAKVSSLIINASGSKDCKIDINSILTSSVQSVAR